jgi:serine/threonine protein phosphatase PrpC
LTEDHKPELDEEKERIERAGGFVQFNRVNGELAMSRALGDFRYKLRPEIPVHEQQVIPVPDIAIHERSSDDKVIVLACDGVWDVLQNNEAVEFLTDIVYAEEGSDIEQRHKKKRKEAPEISAQEGAENLIQLALNDGSKDNISAIVVKLPGLYGKPK